MFPTTPLLGIFGNGEVGHSFVPNEQVKDTFSDPSASKRSKPDAGIFDPTELSHSYTTIFVLLSFQ